MKQEVNLIPERLENLAILSVVTWVRSQVLALSQILDRAFDENADACFTLLARHVADIAEYLDRGVFRAAFNDVANKIIGELRYLIDDQAVNIQHPLYPPFYRLKIFTCYTAARMAEIVFNKKLTSLTMFNEIFCWSVRFPSRNQFVEKAHLLTQLTELEIKYYHSTDSEPDIIQFITKLNLRCLSLAGFDCNVDMMTCIAQNEFIEELNLKGSVLDDTNISWITQLRHLRMINLEDTGVSSDSFKTLLLSCKHLEYVEGCELAHIMKDIESSPEYNGQVFEIKRYSTLDDPEIEDLQILFKMCPRVSDVEMYSIYPHDNLQALTVLTDLQKLTLRSYDFYEDRLWDVMDKIGHNLRELYIYKMFDLDKNVLLYLNSVCPNLETLAIRSISCPVRIQYITESKFNITRDCRPFPVLKSVNMAFTSYVDDTIRLLDIFSTILSNCVNVEHIDIHTEHANFSGSIMLDYLNSNPMEYLETLKMTGSIKVLRPVVDEFIKRCVRLLKINCITQ